MAQFGNSAYSLTISSIDSSNDKSTKTISGINYNATGAGGGSTALGADVDTLNEFSRDILQNVMTGTDYEISFTEKKPIDNTP